jgi:hypothetical protein
MRLWTNAWSPCGAAGDSVGAVLGPREHGRLLCMIAG